MASRRLRAFKRWMKSKGFGWSDALEFVDTPEEGITVRALCQLKEGDVVAKMPKEACLTTKTSGARETIEEAGLDGHLGLAFAIMYERSLGGDSPWSGYLQLLPFQECVPIVWTLNEVNKLLCGTELHQAVQEDKALIYEDWKENILPLLDLAPSKLNLKFFGIEQYFAAKSLISSRSFEIDDYHGFGMVPLADLFNHKTGAEDVHFTAMSSNYESDTDVDDCNKDDNIVEEEAFSQNSSLVLNIANNGNDIVEEEAFAQNSSLVLNTANNGNGNVSDLDSSSVSEGDASMLEMIMIKDVSSGTEIFNTYGILGNAALLHRFCHSIKKEQKREIVNCTAKNKKTEEEGKMALKETFFISHGSPTLSIDDSIPAWKFLSSWKEVFPQRPSSILVISGHWDTDVPTVNVVDHNDTIYDYYGFPKPMYKLKYPAPGAPHVAKRVKELLKASGLSRVDEDRKRGLDHGAWVPLMLMYPEADIPVCQLSISSHRDGTYHYNLGKALSPLKDEGVLIIGSGSAVHNLRAIGPRNSPPAPWAVAFDSWLKNSLIQARYEEVNKFEEKAPYAKLAHPWPDHFFPLHVAMGAAGENSKAKIVHDSWDAGSMSYASFGFTAATS